MAAAALLVASTSANAAACPNEAFRTGPSANLPDCRAYELVTPLDQSDVAIPLFGTTPDGNMSVFGSLGAFAGGLNGGGNGYVARRGSDGWATQGMTPPGSGSGDEPVFVPLDVSSDGNRVIWKAQNEAGGRDVLLGDGPGVATSLSGPVRVTPNDEAFYEGRSTNLGHIVFGLYEGGAYAGGTSRLYDYTGGSAKPVGILPGETTPAPGGAVLGSYEFGYGGGSVFNAISADGSRLFFESPMPPEANNGPPPNPSGLYLRENGTTTKEIDPNAAFWGADASGSTAVYGPVDGEGHMGLSRYDVASETSTQIVPTSAEVTGVAGMSADTSHVYFTALGDLAAGATAGQPNLYLYDGGGVRFIATINEWEAGHFASKMWSNAEIMSEASDDGRLLAFVSTKRLLSYDNEGIKEVYLFDADAVTDPIVCISCNKDGSAPQGESHLQTRSYSTVPGLITPAQEVAANMPTNITADNSRIFFQTVNALAPRDTNGVEDVYVWEGGQANLISSGTGKESLFVSATPSGDDAFFTSSNSLVPQAKLTSELTAIYDARVGGGFRTEAPSVSCEQDGSCQGALKPPPAPPFIGSVDFGDAGSPSSSNKASVKVKQPKVVSGTAARLQVRVSGAGRIAVSGKSVRSTSKSVGKAGSYQMTIRLKPSAKKQLRKKGKLRVNTRVSYQPKTGRSASKTVTVTFKQPKAKPGKGKKGGR
jgi:hypothetical protein